MVHAEFTADFDEQVVDVVANSPGPVGTEVGEILRTLAALTPASSASCSEDAFTRPYLESKKTALIYRKPGNGCFGNYPPSRGGHLPTVQSLFKYSQSRGCEIHHLRRCLMILPVNPRGMLSTNQTLLGTCSPVGARPRTR